MQFYKTKSNSFFKPISRGLKNSIYLRTFQSYSQKLGKFTIGKTDRRVSSNNFIYLGFYSSLISYITFQGIFQSTSLFPIQENTQLYYRLNDIV